MKKYKLASLSKVALRSIWTTEAQEFTPWLAQSENMELLGEAIGLELELEASEKNVGPFRADILCKDVNSDQWVLIENQLESTDHVHLGQILTYAAGLKALTIVWIAKKFTEEHRATLDWLNEVTDSRINFFGLEIELWKIGNSDPAPKFNVVVEPNDWTNRISEAASTISTEGLSETKKLQWEYWSAFSDFLKKTNSQIRPYKASPQHWLSVSLGRSGIHLSATVNSQKESIAAEVYMGDARAKKFFQQLLEHKEEIEQEVGSPLEWMELPDKKASRIVIRLEKADFEKKTDWPRQHDWIRRQLEALKQSFGMRAKTLEAQNEDKAA